MKRHVAQAGDYVRLDKWGTGEKLTPDALGFALFRIPACNYELTVEVVVTGKPHLNLSGGPRYRSRCKITFRGDRELDVVSGGWIYHDEVIEN